MRIRQPELECPSVNALASPNIRKFDVELVTHMVGGGIDAMKPDELMPVRASSIRGQLRYWWRFLNRINFGDSRELFSAERELWGGMGAGDQGYPSMVRLSVQLQNKPGFEEIKDSALPYALFPFRGQKEKKWIKRGMKFKLLIECEERWWPGVEEALRWWVTFGGLGARTRRGLGQVHIDRQLLKPVTEEEAEQQGCRLEIRRRDTDSAWQASLTAVNCLKEFRQGVQTGRNPGSQPGRPGRSRWPEADTIRQMTMQHAERHPVEHPLVKDGKQPFPRAYFGLPIIFEIRGIGEPPKQSLQPEGMDRMASPLILFPYPAERRQFYPAALCLPTDHFQNLDLELKQLEGQERTRPVAAGQWWPRDGHGACHWAGKIRPMKDRGCDPLEAFLKFFREN